MEGGISILHRDHEHKTHTLLCSSMHITCTSVSFHRIYDSMYIHIPRDAQFVDLDGQ